MKMKTWDEANKGGIDSYENYIGDTSIKDMMVFIGQSRDSDAMERSNFECGLKLLGGESKDVQVHRFGHWGCGWFEQILIQPTATDTIAIAEKTLDELLKYPVIDEEHFCGLEYEEATELWQQLDRSEKVDYCKRSYIDGRQANRKTPPSEVVDLLMMK